MIWMHCITQTNFIGTDESAYGDSDTGNLDTKSIWVRDMHPLQHRFDSNSQTGFSIGIDNLTTLASEQGIIGRMSIPDSTAAGTPFGSVPTINFVQNNIIIKTSLFKNLLEFKEWNPHDCSICSSSDRFEFFELLNSDVRIESLCYLNDLSNGLPKGCLDEVRFIISHLHQFFGCSNGLQFCSPFHHLLSSCPDMPSKICLIENFSVRRQNRDCNMFGIYINSEYILPRSNLLLFGEIRNDLTIGSQSKCLADPSVSNERIETLKIPILSDRNCDSVSWINPKFDKKFTFGIKCFTISRNIEFDSNGSKIISFLFPSLTNERTDNLNIEGGVFLAS